MQPNIVRLDKKDDLAAIIRRIRTLKGKEVVFEIPKGSRILHSSDNLRMIKRTGEANDKKVYIETSDDIGRVLAVKAGVLWKADEDIKLKLSKAQVRPEKPNRSLRPIFSDFKPASGDKLAEPKNRKKFSPQVKSTIKIGLIIILVLAIFLAGLVVFLPKATITVFARSETVTRDNEFVVDISVKQVDTKNGIVPGILVKKEISKTLEFEATGVSLTGNKASGEVVIYNFSGSTLTLKAATTTLVVDGKRYFFTKDATGIRPTKRTVEGVVDKTSLTVPIGIVAEKPGDTYNTNPRTKFIIENQALGNRDVYALNDKAIRGGSATSSTVLSSEDLTKAEAAMIIATIAQAQEDWNQENPEKTIELIPGSATVNVLAKTANKNVGEKTDKFDMTIIVQVSALGFNKDQVANLIVERINSVLSDDKYLVEGAARKLDPKFKNLDLSAGKGTLLAHFETLAAYRIEASSLRPIVKGKNDLEIKEILLTKPEVEEVEVRFWPALFVKNAPKIESNIDIQVKLAGQKGGFDETPLF